MKQQLTAGKWRGLKATSSLNHTFSMVAFDQRGNYLKMLPPGATYAEAAEIKRSVIAALSPHVSAVLLDPNYGMAAVNDAAGSSGLLMALEKTGYGGEPTARQVDFMDGWTVGKIKAIGASAVKLLVYYHPDAGAAADSVEATIREVASACDDHDIALFVEPLAYSPDPAVSSDSAAFAAQRARIVRETARRLSRLGVDVLKLEFPVDIKHNADRDEWRAACEAVSEACSVPWVLLSAGVDFEVFRQQVEMVCKAGASGYLGGRAIWKEAVTMTAADREVFLATQGRERVQTLGEIAAQYGRRWTAFFAPPAAGEGWYTEYDVLNDGAETVRPTTETRALPLVEFVPRSKLVVKETEVRKPRFPVIDAHNHLADPFGGGWDRKPVSELLDRLDEAHVRAYVDLDGGWGEEILHRHLDHFKAAAPERFFVFGGVNWQAWTEHGEKFGEWAAKRLREQAARGADGLKIWKPFGLHVHDQRGQLVAVDDPRLDPIWQTAGELRLPVLAHVADPVAFFDPLDATNERYEELHAHPDWQFPSPPFPPFLKILRDFAALVKRHPQTTFIGAHVGCYSEDLGWVGQMLDACPNYYVDISARISELGRQPYTSRRFFTQYADRILFGLDLGPEPEAYRRYYRFLESDDEYFNYGESEVPGQGRWNIYGLALPDDVLEKVYFRNAERVLLNR